MSEKIENNEMRVLVDKDEIEIISDGLLDERLIAFRLGNGIEINEIDNLKQDFKESKPVLFLTKKEIKKLYSMICDLP
jgi:hypothetical protein